MSSNAKSSSKTFDTLIVGGGLTGLFLAHRLHHANHRVALLEARETLGGRYGRKSAAVPFSSAGLDFFPATDENLELLEWARSVAPIPLQFEVQEARPQLYDEGRWRPFAGFGEVDFASVTELAPFSATHEIFLEPGLEHLTRALVEQLPFAAQTMSEVTQLKIDGGRVGELIVNGDRAVSAENVIFTPHPSALNELIEGEGLAAKHRTRLAKMQPWTAVILELRHETALADDPSIRIFTHSAKEFEPVVGRVTGGRSRWMTLVPGERDAEHDFIAQCIRHIKRQLKRAWPNAFDGKVEEKIFVQPNAFGQQLLKNKEGLRFGEISNLWLGNHILASRAGEIGALETVQALEGALVSDRPPVEDESEKVPGTF